MEKVDLSVLAKEDPFDLIGQQWMLITAGSIDSFNTMTASWGGFGYLWNRPVAFIFVRPERYTHDFIEANAKVTLSFYPESCRKALNLCGTKSGRDCDKAAEAGLTPVEIESGAVTFEQARLTVVGHKIFKSEMTGEQCLDSSIMKWYGPRPNGSFHTVYVVEIDELIKGSDPV